MTASHGLRSDSHDVVYSEDVVTYADPQDVADGTSDAYGVCVGLVSRVAGDDGTIRFWVFTEEAVETDAPPSADAENVVTAAAEASDEARPPADVADP